MRARVTFIRHFPRDFEKPLVHLFGRFTIVEARIEIDALEGFQRLGCVLDFRDGHVFHQWFRKLNKGTGEITDLKTL